MDEEKIEGAASEEDWQKVQDAAEAKAQQDFAESQAPAREEFEKTQKEAAAKAEAMREQWKAEAEQLKADSRSAGSDAAQNFDRAQQQFDQAQQFNQSQQFNNQSQQYGQPQQYGQSQPNGQQSGDGYNEALAATIVGAGALIFALMSGIFAWLNFIFLVLPIALGIAGLVLAANAKKKGYAGGLQKAGFYTSLAGLIIGCIAMVSCGACSAAVTCIGCACAAKK